MMMNSQIMVCDQITGNAEQRCHQLGNILNHIDIPVLPYAVDISILLKLFDISPDQPIDTKFEFRNNHGELIGKTGVTVLRNYRAKDQVPGVDKDFTVTLVLTEPGIVHINCIVNGEITAWYPLTVRLQDERQPIS